MILLPDASSAPSFHAPPNKNDHQINLHHRGIARRHPKSPLSKNHTPRYTYVLEGVLWDEGAAPEHIDMEEKKSLLFLKKERKDMGYFVSSGKYSQHSKVSMLIY